MDPNQPEDGTTNPPEGGDGGQEPGGSKPSGKQTPPEGYVTEESYRGIQRIVAKRDEEIVKLKTKLEELATQVEESKASSGNLSAAKTALETQVQQAQGQLQSLTAERDKLNKQLEQQGIVMAEFPDLAALAMFIPVADTPEKFRENAAKFREAVQKHITQGVRETLKGSSPAGTQPVSPAAEGEEEKLWRQVYALAGIPGKEAEYQEANRKLQDLLRSKNG